jgi:cyclic pyranopterin phosphate synthase
VNEAAAAAGGPANDALGRPLGDLRLSVTDRCNFRCPYCMPEEVFGERYHFLPKPEILSFEEIERLARIFVGLGVEKLRITGGEPLLRVELPKLVARLAAIEGVKDLALTTNGHLLARHARALAEAGLRRVTVSLDSHDEAVFRRMSGGRSRPAEVLAGIEAAERAGLAPVKVNCVVQRGVNDGAVVEMARRFHGTGRILRFIEFMDVGTRNGWDRRKVVSAAEIAARIDAALPLEALPPRTPGETARRFRYRDGGGEIGFIASVTAPFCGGCTRAPRPLLRGTRRPRAAGRRPRAGGDVPDRGVAAGTAGPGPRQCAASRSGARSMAASRLRANARPRARGKSAFSLGIQR